MPEASSMTRRPAMLLARLMMLIALSFAAVVQPASAQSILRDAETELLLKDISRPLIEAAGLRPDDVQVILIQDNSINAFVAGGQAVYIHSGLIEAADTANEVQGVIAHELGHIVGGHVIRMNEGVKAATSVMLLSLLLGVAAMAGIPSGTPDWIRAQDIAMVSRAEVEKDKKR